MAVGGSRKAPTAPDEGSVDSPLGVLGIGLGEETLYRLLLARGPTTADEAAQALGESPRQVQRMLDAIEAMGLATHAPERPRRYVPAAPDVAVEALISQRQASLERARAAIPALKEQAAAGRVPGREPIVELITGHEAERQVFEQMHHLVQREMLTLMRPPMRISRLDVPFDQDQRHQMAARARGVTYRSIVDSDYLALPGAGARSRDDLAAGEQIRMVPALPFKLMLADRRIALIPLNLHRHDSPSLLVRSSALLDALYELFESLWGRSTPIALAGETPPSGADEAMPADAADLIPLLSAGLNDKAIAHELGISASTLARRIASLMKGLGTRTRFQLGWRSALAAFPPRGDTSAKPAAKPPSKPASKAGD
jgi:sugar-specific transcriptional regulator TrmB